MDEHKNPPVDPQLVRSLLQGISTALEGIIVASTNAGHVRVVTLRLPELDTGIVVYVGPSSRALVEAMALGAQFMLDKIGIRVSVGGPEGIVECGLPRDGDDPARRN